MSGEHTERKSFWSRLRKLIDEIEDIFSGPRPSDYEIYGDYYERF